MTTQIGSFIPSSLPFRRTIRVMSRVPYDEFGSFDENREEWGLTVPVPPVARVSFSTDGTRSSFEYLTMISS